MCDIPTVSKEFEDTLNAYVRAKNSFGIWYYVFIPLMVILCFCKKEVQEKGINFMLDFIGFFHRVKADKEKEVNISDVVDYYDSDELYTLSILDTSNLWVSNSRVSKTVVKVTKDKVKSLTKLRNYLLKNKFLLKGKKVKKNCIDFTSPINTLLKKIYGFELVKNEKDKKSYVIVNDLFELEKDLKRDFMVMIKIDLGI